MKNIINIFIGAILGLSLGLLTINANAYSNDPYTPWEREVIDLLEELVDKGEDISSDTQTIIDKL